MPPWRLQARLRNRLLALLAAIWVLASAFTLAALWRETGAVLDSALQETAERLLLMPASAWSSPDTAEVMDRFGDHHELVVYQVFAECRLMWRSQKAPAAPLAPAGSTGLLDAGPWRVYALGSEAGPYVQVAEPLAHRRALVGSQFVGLSVALFVLLGLAALAVNWVLQRAFRDLEPARRQLADLGADGLHPVDGTAAPAELQPWIETVNALLARLARLVDSERAFAADAAHELRTPLAAARAQLQRLQRAVADDERAASAQAVARQLDRMTRLCSRLLQLARVEAGTALRREPVDLEELARLVVGEQREARRGGHVGIVRQGPAAVALGDIDALGIALGNLVGNAVQHAGEAARIVVTVNGTQVSVEDDGPGVDDGRLPELVRRFDRGAVRRDLLGSGIGLALADRIARDTGGRLVLQSPCAGGRGFRATLVLPPARADVASPA